MAKKTPPPASRWRNRIVGHADVPPKEITKNDKNWREHPVFQQESMQDTLDQIGWIQEIIVNKTTGRLIDGHLRLDLALKNNEPTVPVKYVELTEDEENLALLTFDPIGAMATANLKALQKLQKESQKKFDEVVKTEQRPEALETLVNNASTAFNELRLPESFQTPSQLAKQLPDDPQSETRLPQKAFDGVYDLQEVVWFELGQVYDIPPTRPDRLADCPEPIGTWTTPESIPDTEYFLTALGNGNVHGMPFNKTILCMHVDDGTLEEAWSDTVGFTKSLLRKGYYAVMSPEFSVAIGHPKACRIFNTYRNRYAGRYFQEAGIKIIPTIPHIMYKGDEQFLYAGLPKGLPCVSVQMQNHTDNEGNKLSEEDQINTYRISLNTLVSALAPQSLIVYGGPHRDKMIDACKLPKTLHVVSMTNFITERGKYLRKRRQRQV